MVKVGDKFNYLGTWHEIVDIKGDTVTTIEDLVLNKCPNIRDYTYWHLHQVEELVKFK